jgi:hypothetical protein
MMSIARHSRSHSRAAPPLATWEGARLPMRSLRGTAACTSTCMRQSRLHFHLHAAQPLALSLTRGAAACTSTCTRRSRLHSHLHAAQPLELPLARGTAACTSACTRHSRLHFRLHAAQPLALSLVFELQVDPTSAPGGQRCHGGRFP